MPEPARSDAMRPRSSYKRRTDEAIPLRRETSLTDEPRRTRAKTAIVTELRAGGTTIRDEGLVHVWPLQRRHITPNGVYFANRTMPAFVLPDPVEA